MKASKLAGRLQEVGLPIVEMHEPCEPWDGSLSLTDRVHASVPRAGRRVGVVIGPPLGPLVSWPCHDVSKPSGFNALTADLRKAIDQQSRRSS